jgi:hypothetical protein
MEILWMFGFFCLAPLAFVAFGYWLGAGAPGWPWALVKRDAPGLSQSHPHPYYDEEVYQK